MSTFFSWEEKYKRTWEDTAQKTQTAKTPIFYEKEYKPYKRGTIRHLHLLVDMSSSIDSTDFLPSFRYSVIAALQAFIKRFFEENPISNLSILTVKNGVSDTFSLIDTNFDIQKFLFVPGSGHFSILNGLESSYNFLKDSVYIKEVVVITASLSTRDPGDLENIIRMLKSKHIKVHIISLCGELKVFSIIAQRTLGRQYVPMNADNLNQILMNFCIPDTIASGTINLLKVGFPELKEGPSVCTCHFNITDMGYICPMCSSKVCSLPMQCPICDIQLVSTVNLAMSLHHLYPLQPFIEGKGEKCCICKDESYSKCSDCGSFYCKKCDDFIHEHTNFCSFC